MRARPREAAAVGPRPLTVEKAGSRAPWPGEGPCSGGLCSGAVGRAGAARARPGPRCPVLTWSGTGRGWCPSRASVVLCPGRGRPAWASAGTGSPWSVGVEAAVGAVGGSPGPPTAGPLRADCSPSRGSCRPRSRPGALAPAPPSPGPESAGGLLGPRFWISAVKSVLQLDLRADKLESGAAGGSAHPPAHPRVALRPGLPRGGRAQARTSRAAVLQAA